MDDRMENSKGEGVQKVGSKLQNIHAFYSCLLANQNISLLRARVLTISTKISFFFLVAQLHVLPRSTQPPSAPPLYDCAVRKGAEC